MRHHLPSVTFPPMEWQQVRMRVQGGNDITAKVRTNAPALLWTQGTKEGAGKEARSGKIQSGFKCLSLPKISEWISLHINPY